MDLRLFAFLRDLCEALAFFAVKRFFSEIVRS